MKYLKKNTVLSWIRSKDFSAIGVSAIWKGFISSISWLGCGLIWMVGDGESIRVGLDPITGMGTSFTLPQDLRDYLEDYGIISLAHAINYFVEAKTYWLTASDLDLGGEWHLIWNEYVKGMEYGRIRLRSNPDSLLWSYKNYSGSLNAAMAYECIVDHYLEPYPDMSFDYQILWKFNIPEKTQCFIWLLLNNKV